MSNLFKGRNIKKACFFFPHGIGDVICNTPIVSAFRSEFPDLHITIIVKNNVIANLFGGNTQVNQILLFDLYSNNSLAAMLRFAFRLRREKFDIFISDHSGKTPLLAFLSGAKIRVGEKSKNFSFLYSKAFVTNYEQHKVVNNWKMLSLFGITTKPDPYVYFSSEDLKFVDDKISSIINFQDFIVIHPGCGLWGVHKRWSREKFHHLISMILERLDTKIFLVGDKDEIDICKELIEKNPWPDKLFSVAGMFNIRQMSAFLSKAQLAIGNDSGIMHLASACNVRTITLFGPTLHKWCAPFKNNTVITKKIECSPCYLNKPFGCGNPVCMEKIEVMDVYSAIEKVSTKQNSSFEML